MRARRRALITPTDIGGTVRTPSISAVHCARVHVRGGQNSYAPQRNICHAGGCRVGSSSRWLTCSPSCLRRSREAKGAEPGDPPADPPAVSEASSPKGCTAVRLSAALPPAALPAAEEEGSALGGGLSGATLFRAVLDAARSLRLVVRGVRVRGVLELLCSCPGALVLVGELLGELLGDTLALDRHQHRRVSRSVPRSVHDRPRPRRR